MDSNKEDKVPTSTHTNDNHHVPMDIDMSACEDDCMGDDSDSEMDMQTLMATINKRDPNVRAQITFTKDKTLYRTLDSEPSDEPSIDVDESELDSKHVDKEVKDKSHSSDHDHDHDNAGCACKQSNHVTGLEQEVTAISAAEKEWKDQISKYMEPYKSNKFGLHASDRLNLAQSLGVVPTARRQTDHEYAASLQAAGKKAKRRRPVKKSKHKKSIVKKVAFITNLDELMTSLNECKNGCFHEVDLACPEWKSRIIVRASTIMNMKSDEQAKFFKEAIIDNIAFTKKHPIGKGTFMFSTVSICPHCFYRIHGCSRSRYYGYVKAVKAGLRGVDDQKVRQRQQNVTFNFEA